MQQIQQPPVERTDLKFTPLPTQPFVRKVRFSVDSPLRQIVPHLEALQHEPRISGRGAVFSSVSASLPERAAIYFNFEFTEFVTRANMRDVEQTHTLIEGNCDLTRQHGKKVEGVITLSHKAFVKKLAIGLFVLLALTIFVAIVELNSNSPFDFMVLTSSVGGFFFVTTSFYIWAIRRKIREGQETIISKLGAAVSAGASN